ncbi:MAG TPA: hypothetical protein VIG25_17530, partial [Pyrinomonadaceae bacterium]
QKTPLTLSWLQWWPRINRASHSDISESIGALLVLDGKGYSEIYVCPFLELNLIFLCGIPCDLKRKIGPTDLMTANHEPSV